MIKEIVEFMDANEGIEEYFIQDDVSPSYLHYYFKIHSKMICKSLIDIENLMDADLKNTLKYMAYYQKGMHNKYLDKNDGLGGSSPYILTIKMLFNGVQITTNITEKKKNRIDVQFNSAREYLEEIEEKMELKKLRRFFKKHFEKCLMSEQKIIADLKEKYDNQKKEKKPVSIDIRIYIDVGLGKVKSFYEKFVQKRAFLSAEKFGIHKGVCSICGTESDELSLPYILNSGGDDFGMKPTMPIELINHICKTCTLKLHKFKVMTDNNQLTKPFPLFLDKKNLFGQQQAILKDDTKKKSYREIIKAIWHTNPKDLKNFYLLNYYSKSDNGWKLQIKDIDYIENFEYMTLFKITNFMELRNSFKIGDFYEKELSVFQFEKIINDLIFENNLQKYYFADYNEKGFELKYRNSENKNSLLKNYLLKYRQNFYDFIYKSHRTRLQEVEFREMILDIIKDNIRHDGNNKNGYSIYENEIVEKLNVLFSIKHYFKNGGGQVDQGEFIRLREKMDQSLGHWVDEKDEQCKVILKEDGKTKRSLIAGVDFVENDDHFFAFLCGQMARFLISKKKGKEENKNHSDFSAFTDWQKSKLLKEYIYDIHRKYAHELKFKKRYDHAMCIIQTYHDDLNIDSVMEYMVAGYFADNHIEYQNNQTQENTHE